MKKKQKTALQLFADWIANLTPKEKEKLQVSHSQKAFVIFVDKGVKFGKDKNGVEFKKPKTKKI